MKYSIEVNGIVEVEVALRDTAIFIARKLKEAHFENEVIVYKEGEFLYRA